MAAPTSKNSIPIVDLSAFTFSTEYTHAQQEAARDLVKACQNLGFSYIVGHGVSDSLLLEAFSWSKKLFDLQHADKMKAPHPAGAMPHRGYSHPGLEKVYSKEERSDAGAKESNGDSLRKIMDFKESYEIGSEHNPPQPNIWLPEETLPGFRAFMTSFYWELAKTSQNILRAFCIGLDLTNAEKDMMMHIHSGHNNQLRLLHYPPVPAGQLEKEVLARMPAHNDWSSFTLLFQDDCGGLELEDRKKSGDFMAATPLEHSLVLNIGDMFQRASNDTFKSATHRVALPPLQERYVGNERITRERYSIPYFVAPDNEEIVSCLATCVDEKHPARYEPIKFADYGAWVAKYSYKEIAKE